MASVGVIYIARKLASRTALECYVLAVAAFALTVMVSVSHVTRNFLGAAHNINSLAVYLTVAVAQTTHVVQIVLLIAAAATVALGVDIVRSFTAAAVSSRHTLAA